jgi:hypothetical protein
MPPMRERIVVALGGNALLRYWRATLGRLLLRDTGASFFFTRVPAQPSQ